MFEQAIFYEGDLNEGTSLRIRIFHEDSQLFSKFNIIESYCESAKILYNHIFSDILTQPQHDYLAYPLLQIYVNIIEFILKYYIYKQGSIPKSGHILSKLYKELDCTSVLSDTDIHYIISELERFNINAGNIRYLDDKNQNPYALSRSNICFNIKLMHEKVINIFNKVSSIEYDEE